MEMKTIERNSTSVRALFNCTKIKKNCFCLKLYYNTHISNFFFFTKIILLNKINLKN